MSTSLSTILLHGVIFYRGINKQLSQVVDTLFVSPIINSNNIYTLLLHIEEYIVSN
jgi:hypothetical protein